MALHQIFFPPSFTGWQKAARKALQAEWTWESVLWEEQSSEQPSLHLEEESLTLPILTPAVFKVPKTFVEMAVKVACHRDPDRWGLLYRLLWRLTHGEPHLLKVAVDRDVYALLQMEKAVRHDVHKMRAFVRFREVVYEGQTSYVAWFEPQHQIVEYNSGFFRDRFASMHWSILTPDQCAHWNGEDLTFTPGVNRSAAPTEDAVEYLWLKYYSHIFNPARVKTHAMLSEMPKRYWKNLPEAAVIPALLSQATPRVAEMMVRSKAKETRDEDWYPAMVPDTDDLEVLRDAAATCQACPLYKHATQTVFGEGRLQAKVVLLGEQPGDQEDLAGHPFIGPAGKLLDRALEEAGIDRKNCYVTNAVKHFKWKPHGKRRLHEKPAQADIKACKPWWQAELRLIQPRFLICLGSTAASAVLEHTAKVGELRGKFMETSWSADTLITVHPSSLLRQPDPEAKEREYAHFVADLAMVAHGLHS